MITSLQGLQTSGNYPKVLISLSDIIQILRSRINDFRINFAHESTNGYPIWRDGGYDTIDYIRRCIAGAMYGDSYPIDALSLLETAGMDYEYAKEITLTIVDSLQGILVDQFPNHTLAQLQKFSFGVMDDGNLFIWPNGQPPTVKQYIGVDDAGSNSSY